MQEASSHMNRASVCVCVCVLACVDADRVQTANTTALTASRGPVTLRQGLEWRGKREYGEYRKRRIWQINKKKGCEKRCEMATCMSYGQAEVSRGGTEKHRYEETLGGTKEDKRQQQAIWCVYECVYVHVE